MGGRRQLADTESPPLLSDTPPAPGPAHESPHGPGPGAAPMRRTLIGCGFLLLLTVLLVRHHLAPAKRRLGIVTAEHRQVLADLRDAERSNRVLSLRLAALENDPFYRERLQRRMFRLTSDPDERILKPRP